MSTPAQTREKSRRIVVTGIGAVSPVGIGVETMWSSLVAGRNGIAEISSFDTSQYRTHVGGEVKNFRPIDFMPRDKARRRGRGAQFAVAAARLAMEHGRLSTEKLNGRRLGVVCGSTMGESQVLEKIDKVVVEQGYAGVARSSVSSCLPDTIATAVAEDLEMEGPALMIMTACAAGNYAIGYAADLLRAGTVDVMLAGGAEPFSRIAYTGFSSMLALAPAACQPFDLNRRGLCLSEGSALLLLETYEGAVRRGAHILAEVLSYAITNDAYHMTAPHPQARGAIKAMRQALAEAHVAPEDVDYISAHGTGTSANDKVEALAINTVFEGMGRKVAVSSIKSMIGHTLGAASALEAAASVMVINDGVIPPTVNYETADPLCDLDCVPNQSREGSVDIVLSNAFAFGGNCSSLVLGRVDA